MSVYIKDMEMPTDAPVIIKICPDGSVSRVHEGVVATAIPVPDHGDLIDRKATVDILEPSDFWNPDAEDNCFAAAHVINSMPTIIPADKEGGE